MPDLGLSPARFGPAFKAFMDAMVAQAAAGLASPLLERVRDHVGAEPTLLPVIAEELDTFEHPTSRSPWTTTSNMPAGRLGNGNRKPRGCVL